MLRYLQKPVVLVFVGFVVLNRRLESRLEFFFKSRRLIPLKVGFDENAFGQNATTTNDVAMKEIERQNFRRGNRA